MNKQAFVGKFEIQGEISQGATGTIYYGYDLELRQEVAIKIYHSHINGRLVRGKTFIEKSKPLLKLDHPNLIKIFKVEEDNDTPIVFMEFFDGPSLQQIIREKGPLSVEHMLMLAQGIAEVLVHTHFQGLIHGTLHPGHVLVGPQNQIKVMDLGLSWILMDILSDFDEDLLRPLPYLPPESAKGELLTLSSDLYSLGFMMYEMLTKTTPYAGFPKTSIMGKLAFDQSDPPFEFPESVPEGVRDLICQITRNKPQTRLQDATHVLTIINQQLAKLNPAKLDSSQITEGLRKPKPSQPLSQAEAPAPNTPAPVTEALHATDIPEASGPLSSTPSSVPSQTPSFDRPSARVNYQKNSQSTWKRNLGFILGVLLLVIGGSMGYWFRGSFDPTSKLEAPRPPVPTSQKPMAPPHIPSPLPVESSAQREVDGTAIPANSFQETLPQVPQMENSPPISLPVKEKLPIERSSEKNLSPKLPVEPAAPNTSLPKKPGNAEQTELPIPTPLEQVTTIPHGKPQVSTSEGKPPVTAIPEAKPPVSTPDAKLPVTAIPAVKTPLSTPEAKQPGSISESKLPVSTPKDTPVQKPDSRPYQNRN